LKIKQKNPTEYGGLLEIEALEQLLDCSIKVYIDGILHNIPNQRGTINIELDLSLITKHYQFRIIGKYFKRQQC
jgi:hypothetical protein